MPYYWVLDKKRKVAAEFSDEGSSVHDQALSWQLFRMKQEGGIPVTAADGSESRQWNLDALLRFVQENNYTIERKDVDIES